MVYKKILAVILAAVMAVTLVGCDSHSNITESVSTETEERYSVKLHIEFPSNLLLSKYDVDVNLDGKKQGTLAHGNDGDFEIQLTSGEHTLTFVNEKASSVKGEVKFNISGDAELGYKIGCHSDRIDVEEKYSVNRNSVSENESSAPISSDDVRKKDYQELETLFKNAGFTNITTEPLYDIIFGITKEGETESISIDGKTEFKYGDVFNKDSEVSIVYHLKAENDPLRPEEDEETSLIVIPEESVESIEIESLPEDAALKNCGKYMVAFEKYGREKYPHGFTCDWVFGLHVIKEYDEGKYYFMVPCNVTYANGNTRSGTAHGIVMKQGDNYVVDTFGVSL